MVRGHLPVYKQTIIMIDSDRSGAGSAKGWNKSKIKYAKVVWWKVRGSWVGASPTWIGYYHVSCLLCDVVILLVVTNGCPFPKPIIIFWRCDLYFRYDFLLCGMPENYVLNGNSPIEKCYSWEGKIYTVISKQALHIWKKSKAASELGKQWGEVILKVCWLTSMGNGNIASVGSRCYN